MDMLQKNKFMLFAMVLKDIVERPKGHSRLGVITRPSDIVLGGEVLHWRYRAHCSFYFQNVVNYSEGNFIRGDVVQSKNRVYDFGLLLKGSQFSVQSFLHLLQYLLPIGLPLIENVFQVFIQYLLLLLHENRIELICSDVIVNVEGLHNLFHAQRSSDQQISLFLAIFGQDWLQGSMIHEHSVWVYEISPENSIQFSCLL